MSRRLRRSVREAAFCTWLLCAACSGCGSDSTDSPLVVAEPVFDWGLVEEGDLVRHSFQIENRGPTPVRILQASTDCTCATADYPDAIAAAAVASIDVEVDTTRRFGRPRRAVTVRTDAPDAAAIRLTITGDVTPFFRFQPEVVELRAFAGEVVRQAFEIETITGIEFSLDAPRDLPEGVHVRIVAAEEAASQRVEVEAPVPSGTTFPYRRLDLEMPATLADGSERTMSLPLRLFAMDRILSEPRRRLVVWECANAGSVWETAGPTREIVLAPATPNVHFEVLSVTLGAGHRSPFQTTHRALGDGRWGITVSLAKPLGRPSCRDELEVEVREDDLRVLRYDLIGVGS